VPDAETTSLGERRPGSGRSPALDHVERNPLAEGDFYPGDLLDALMRRVPQSYWQAYEDQRTRVRTVAEALNPDETFDVLYARATEFLAR
jgi:CDI immunity proteins